jgi:acyl-CoA synthetase (NDP forming)
MGGRVALKAIAEGLLHRTEAGAVRLDLGGGAAVRRAAGEMTARLRSGGLEPAGFIVQRMAPAGVEMLVGVVHDSHFGPVVACGAGGIQAELLKDVSVRITPLSDRDATGMIRSLQTFPLLDGFRGAPPARVEALEDVLLRVSALVEDHPELAEMDLNPVLVGPEGAVVVDARARIAEPEAPRPLIAR